MRRMCAVSRKRTAVSVSRPARSVNTRFGPFTITSEISGSSSSGWSGPRPITSFTTAAMICSRATPAAPGATSASTAAAAAFTRARPSSTESRSIWRTSRSWSSRSWIWVTTASMPSVGTPSAGCCTEARSMVTLHPPSWGHHDRLPTTGMRPSSERLPRRGCAGIPASPLASTSIACENLPLGWASTIGSPAW